ncbi:FecR domain-containing protein [Herbaspirillum sp. YR522]|uniref:FecR family protein n=1 Tax=Herbaspirillum sp. YR522 TaxID=1144342 RepID=UPI00026FBC16|nr:FecR domain-containing protein [Herbaspirillum sp. YR522]EJN07752.1 Fe2+-dicitrate sensor, membrane component [Herbaspirillum sp. YR522]
MSTPPVAPASPLREEALGWFVRRGNPHFNAEDEAMFQAWLQADPAHREAFGQWQRQAAQIDAIPAQWRQQLQRNLALDMALDAASARGAGRIGADLAPTATTRSGRRRALAIGGYASLAVASGWLGWRQWQDQARYSQCFETRRGEQSEMVLPDGTVLQLDTQTQVEVVYTRQRRHLRLIDGQLMLAVQKDAERPFQVLSGPVQVTVVGTRFAVRHTPRQVGATGVDVSVSQGRVRVETVGGDPSAMPPTSRLVILGPGDQVHGDARGLLEAVRQVSPEQVGAWQQYHLRFVDSRLDRVLAELSRYRDLPLVIQDPAVAALQVTGVFDPRDLATFQRMLALSLPVRLADLGDGRREVRMRR